MNSLNVENTEFVQNVMEKYDFHDIKVEVTGETEKGTGYIGIIKFIKVTDGNGSKQLHLVLKSAKPSEALRNEAPIRKIFLREIHLYETVLPTLMQFQVKKNILKPFTGIPKLYGCCSIENHESLLMDNLRQDDYSLWNRKVPMNSEHVALVVSEYAKFHAISLAMRHLEPETFKDLTAKLQDVFEGYKNPDQFAKATNPLFEKAFKAVDDNANAKIGLEKLRNGFSEFATDLANVDVQLVVVHGDCWCNNMMFKYEDRDLPKKPTKVCLLDWQISKMSSPVLDLSYFLLVSASMEVIHETNKYLMLYHEVVSENLRNFGCDPDEIFPFELLQTHWRKFAKMGLIMALMLTNVLLRDAEDTPDFAKAADEGKNFIQTLSEGGENATLQEAYNKRISSLVTYMTENDLL